MFTTYKRFYLLLLTLILFGIIVAACNMPATITPESGNPNAVYTAAAQTVSAQLTRSAGEKPATATVPAVGSPTATATQQPQAPTDTAPAPTQTSAPTKTPVPPTATPIPIPCDRAEFIKDVSVPDGTTLGPGQQFVKTWRLKNTGTCTWNSSYSLVFHDKNSMGGPATSQLTTGVVKPGEMIDVSITLKAPTALGSYEGDWKLRNGSNVIFGIGSTADDYFWVKIKVVNTVNFSFYDKAKDAEWSNATDTFNFGDRNDDSAGIAAYGANVKLEDGKTYAKVLGTYPERIDDGMIKGIFPAYTVKAEDHFRAQIGFKANCGEASVRVQLGYMDGNDLKLLKEWREACDGNLKTLDFDLSDLEGEKVQFVLAVLANGSPSGDKLIWVDPRIQK